MKEILDLVRDFQEKFSQPVSSTPRTTNLLDSVLRFELMKEENEEYLAAVSDDDLIDIADALGDMLYILAGTINHHGLQDKMEPIMLEIQRSNMSKLGADGLPIYREDGKVLKGPNYSKPDLKPIVYGE